MAAWVRASRIVKRFRDRVVLDHVDLEAEPGQIVSLVGPSGCGKSTLLRILAGLAAPCEGSVIVDGRGPGEPHRVGFVSQDPSLFPWRTALQNVEYGFELAGAARAARRGAALDLLELFRLGGWEDRYPAELSGGMRQRVALARALVTRPELLLLDEPFSAVDDQVREQLQACLLQVSARLKVTTVFVTHGIAEAVYVGDRVVVLSSAPARVAGVVEVPLPHPRTRSSHALADLEARVRALVRAPPQRPAEAPVDDAAHLAPPAKACVQEGGLPRRLDRGAGPEVR